MNVSLYSSLFVDVASSNKYACISMRIEFDSCTCSVRSFKKGKVTRLFRYLSVRMVHTAPVRVGGHVFLFAGAN